MNGIDLFHFMENTVRLQQALTQMERVVLKVVGGECICDEPQEARREFRCPVHYEG